MPTDMPDGKAENVETNLGCRLPPHGKVDLAMHAVGH